MSKYTDSVELWTDGAQLAAGPCPGCEECGLGDVDSMDTEEYELANEGESFSSSQCECCGSTFAGERHYAHSIDEEHGILHWDVCVDCLLFLAG